MNTPLEELINKAWDEAQKINISKGRSGGVNAAEALEWMAEQYLKESSHTEEIAIGFSKWASSARWVSKSIGYERISYFGIVERKTDSELFKDYMESEVAELYCLEEKKMAIQEYKKKLITKLRGKQRLVTTPMTIEDFINIINSI